MFGSFIAALIVYFVVLDPIGKAIVFLVEQKRRIAHKNSAPRSSTPPSPPSSCCCSACAEHQYTAISTSLKPLSSFTAALSFEASHSACEPPSASDADAKKAQVTVLTPRRRETSGIVTI